jgi:hypothetical protein
MYSKYSPDYFIVISRFAQRDRRADVWKSEEYKGLRDLLRERFPILVEDEDYVIFDLRGQENRGERAN